MLKIPPHEQGLEEAVLGGMIHCSKNIEKALQYIPTKDVFFNETSKRLFEIIKKMISSDESIDLVTVCAKLTSKDKKKGVSQYYVTSLNNEVTSASLEVYSKALYEKYLLREIINRVRNIESLAFDNNTDVYEKLNTTHSLIGELVAIRPDKKFDIDKELSEAMKSITSDKSKLIRTGYLELDVLAGGLTRGELTIIGGRPGHGKTSFMLNILANVVTNKKRALFFNRELPNSEMMKKIIAKESGKISYSTIRNGVYNESDIDELKRVKDLILDKYNKETFVMHDSIKDITRASTEIKKFKPDIVFDDYIQLIATKGHERERRLEIEKIINEYKWIAKENNCVVVLASQLNRAIETRGNYEPMLSDLAESGSIEQAAENVFFVHYGFKANPDKFPKNRVKIIASKVRYGNTGTVELGYDGDKVDYYPIEDTYVTV